MLEPATLRASVIVVNRNGLRYLQTCLEALLAQEVEGGFEVVMVDNGSTDGSVADVRERWPQVRVIEAGTNLGFAGGNNLGMRQARGRHLVLLNNDTRVRQGWLQALVSASEADRQVGAVASKLVYMDRPGIIQNAGSLVLTDGSGGDRGSGEEDRGQYDGREEVFAACGCGVLYTRAMLEDVGMFDETFFLYYEDTDLSWRIQLRGWRILYEPAAVIEHVHAGTSSEWSPFFIFHVDRNRLFMILKNAPAPFVARSFLRFGMLSVGFAARAALRRAGRSQGAAADPGLSRARIQLGVAGSLVRHLPEMLRKRWRIRRGRRVRDADVMRRLYPRELWDAKLAR
jgi:GT2 family glycosyltransferase